MARKYPTEGDSVYVVIEPQSPWSIFNGETYADPVLRCGKVLYSYSRSRLYVKITSRTDIRLRGHEIFCSRGECFLKSDYTAAKAKYSKVCKKKANKLRKIIVSLDEMAIRLEKVSAANKSKKKAKKRGLT